MNRNQSDKEGGKALFTEGSAVASSIKDKAEVAGRAHGESEQETRPFSGRGGPGDSQPPGHSALGRVLCQWVEVNALRKWQGCGLLHPPCFPSPFFPPLPPTHSASATPSPRIPEEQPAQVSALRVPRIVL